jgi:hypothetical protein
MDKLPIGIAIGIALGAAGAGHLRDAQTTSDR